MADGDGYELPGIAGSGVIACGLAACASQTTEVRLLARSDASAWQAEERAQEAAAKVERGSGSRIKVTTDAEDLSGCDLLVEAIVEDLDAKVELLSELGRTVPEADLASTTSSLSIAALGERSGHPERVIGLHVFNPVDRMELVEVCVPETVRDGVAERIRAWCRTLGKTPIDVPDQPGFVVNRLLFPYLFDAVRVMERSGIEPGDVDACMQLGAGHPMGPLSLLDFVGLDVAESIGDSLHAESDDPAHSVPETIRALVAKGRLGRKTGAGFYEYDD
jgi:3-hydroxybutyryl-CoA dehydrogenase